MWVVFFPLGYAVYKQKLPIPISRKVLHILLHLAGIIFTVPKKVEMTDEELKLEYKRHMFVACTYKMLGDTL